MFVLCMERLSNITFKALLIAEFSFINGPCLISFIDVVL